MKKLTVLLVFLLGVNPVTAFDKIDMLPNEITHKSGITFKLCNKQLITKAFFFDVVMVGLYYKNCPETVLIFDDSEKLLRFHYLRDVKGKQLKEGAEEYLGYNLNEDDKALCFNEYKEFNASYLDVTEGDYYDLYKLNDEGLDLYMNHKPLSQFKNADCENLYFKIWFGRKTMSSDFKKLLSQ